MEPIPLGRRFREHGAQFVTVRGYRLSVRDQIEIVDLGEILPAVG